MYNVQPTRAVNVDTLLTEEKARAKLINEAKLKFGIIDDIDVSGVRLYLDKGMQFDIGQGGRVPDMACGTAWSMVADRECRLALWTVPPIGPSFRPSWAVLAVGQRVPSA